ncbi:N-acetyltransferase [Cryobacterium suzukii]|uniref:N-acetyltransferase n=1 Tax=Cryobacterium suzukii TaxID=1259198 RepID=A0A4R9AET2_9MICO|nr:GNAT family N-acetyltransferase [Cryobacterium suzukii]TFD59936.1 N-acetyltransferase [Cryobacterium suzukii]
MLQIRNYRAADERSWLICRLLSFFDTDYYDDVKICKTTFASDRVELVACSGDDVVGLIDVEIDGDTATIDSIAVHPHAQRQGIASELLHEALRRLPANVTSLDAWTRATESANDWYASAGFSENYRYLHVYKDSVSGDDGFESPAGLSTPVHAFMHARIELEDELRERYSRVYVCRQYLMRL